MFAMLRQFKMTVGRKIYALIGLSFIGVVGIAMLDSRELASGLHQQKQIELQHLTELALGIIKEEHAAAQKGEPRSPTRRSGRWHGSRRCDMAAMTISGSTTCIRGW